MAEPFVESFGSRVRDEVLSVEAFDSVLEAQTVITDWRTISNHRRPHSSLAAQYRRLKPRLGHGRALGAVKHSMLIAYWHMSTTGQTYHDLAGDYLQRRDPDRATKRLIAKLQALGHHVTLQPAAP